MRLNSLKMIGLLSILFMLATGSLWINSQQAHLVTLKERNIQLDQQLHILQMHIEEVQAREASLSAALTTRQQTQQQLEHAYEHYRQQLRQAVVQAPCANQSVPDDIIRLHRDAFNGDFTSY